MKRYAGIIVCGSISTPRYEAYNYGGQQTMGSKWSKSQSISISAWTLQDKTMKDKFKDIPNYNKTKTPCIIIG